MSTPAEIRCSAPALHRHAAEAAQLSITPTEVRGPTSKHPWPRCAWPALRDVCPVYAADRLADRAALCHAAATAGTPLVPPGEAQPFRFDPVHDHDRASGPSQKLHFLLGHFQGQGHVCRRHALLQKEAVGTREVAGRYLALRMGVTYPLIDGHKDTHTALAMIGVHPDTGDYGPRLHRWRCDARLPSGDRGRRSPVC